jgi:hypothetical protein
LLLAIVCELLYNIELTLVDCGHICCSFGDLETEGLALLSKVEHFSGVNECFGGHTASKDAETTERLGSVNDGDVFVNFPRSAGGSVASAAAPEHEVVKVCLAHFSFSS